ncbi:MAG TPA: hypothetical protein VGH13_18400 [Xanthobacteraceae bacterium]|jgi:hypothetical protein
MTSFRQIAANRRNAGKSSGPLTDAGKQRSRGNAVRHGLTAETVIGTLEDAADYAAFEAAIIADYDAQAAVERELVLRLASALWRLRRATALETGLFEIEAEHLAEVGTAPQLPPAARDGVYTRFGATDAGTPDGDATSRRLRNAPAAGPRVDPAVAPPAAAAGRQLAQGFLGLANLPNYALDRLSRYEYTLWRQVAQILFALDQLNRRKPQERQRSRFDYRQQESSPYAPNDE